MPLTSLDPTVLAAIDNRLEVADAALAADYPGGPSTRQPVHTVYVAGHLYTADLAARWGATAQNLLASAAPTADDLAAAVGLRADLVDDVYARVTAKLAREPIEDLRVDFEDGYGTKPDGEEDAAVLAAADALADAYEAGTATAYAGIRFKCLEASTRARGLRTLDLFVSRLLERRGESSLPDGFVVTLPKVTKVEQVDAMVAVCEALETGLGLPHDSLRFELQIETPQAIIGADGTATVARMIHAAAGRCTGLHYGTFDYSAACGVAAAYQSLEHPVADYAKAVMQVAAAGTGARLSDGSTNVLPVGSPDEVRAAWALHARLVRRSLERAYYQGWDMHPGHLVSRFAATYAFFLEGFAAAAARLRAYVGAVETGVMDEPATAQALAGFLVRGLQCGAFDGAQIEAATGVDCTRIEAMAARRVG